MTVTLFPKNTKKKKIHFVSTNGWRLVVDTYLKHEISLSTYLIHNNIFF
jgi:hypothetical protein